MLVKYFLSKKLAKSRPVVGTFWRRGQKILVLALDGPPGVPKERIEVTAEEYQRGLKVVYEKEE